MSTSKYQYAVVVFTVSDETDVVPYKWLYSEDEITFSYYPPRSITQAQYNRCLTECCEPDPTWETFRCRLLYLTDIFVTKLSNYLLLHVTYTLCVMYLCDWHYK